MLMGFETPESGAIYFDQQDQAHLNVEALRRQIGVVLQIGPAADATRSSATSSGPRS